MVPNNISEFRRLRARNQTRQLGSNENTSAEQTNDQGRSSMTGQVNGSPISLADHNAARPSELLLQLINELRNVRTEDFKTHMINLTLEIRSHCSEIFLSRHIFSSLNHKGICSSIVEQLVNRVFVDERETNMICIHALEALSLIIEMTGGDGCCALSCQWVIDAIVNRCFIDAEAVELMEETLVLMQKVSEVRAHQVLRSGIIGKSLRVFNFLQLDAKKNLLLILERCTRHIGCMLSICEYLEFVKRISFILDLKDLEVIDQVLNIINEIRLQTTVSAQLTWDLIHDYVLEPFQLILMPEYTQGTQQLRRKVDLMSLNHIRNRIIEVLDCIINQNEAKIANMLENGLLTSIIELTCTSLDQFIKSIEIVNHVFMYQFICSLLRIPQPPSSPAEHLNTTQLDQLEFTEDQEESTIMDARYEFAEFTLGLIDFGCITESDLTICMGNHIVCELVLRSIVDSSSNAFFEHWTKSSLKMLKSGEISKICSAMKSFYIISVARPGKIELIKTWIESGALDAMEAIRTLGLPKFDEVILKGRQILYPRYSLGIDEDRKKEVELSNSYFESPSASAAIKYMGMLDKLSTINIDSCIKILRWLTIDNYCHIPLLYTELFAQPDRIEKLIFRLKQTIEVDEMFYFPYRNNNTFYTVPHRTADLESIVTGQRKKNENEVDADDFALVQFVHGLSPRQVFIKIPRFATANSVKNYFAHYACMDVPESSDLEIEGQLKNDVVGYSGATIVANYQFLGRPFRLNEHVKNVDNSHAPNPYLVPFYNACSVFERKPFLFELLQRDVDIYKWSGFNTSLFASISLLRILLLLDEHWTEVVYVRNSQPLDRKRFVSIYFDDKIEAILRNPAFLRRETIPEWIVQLAYACPHLISFCNRRKIFYLNFSDADRLIHRLWIERDIQEIYEDEDLISNSLVTATNRIFDFSVKRANAVEDAIRNISLGVKFEKPLLLWAWSVDFSNELGIGEGPNGEFFSIVSKAIMEMEVWTVTFCDGGGIFPKPCVGSGNVDGEYWKFMGLFLAKAITDFQLVHIVISEPLFKWMSGAEATLSIHHLQFVQPTIYCELKIIYDKYINQANDLNEYLESLELEWVLPSNQEYTLPSSSVHSIVTSANCLRYIAEVVDAYLNEGVRRQLQYFLRGFNELIPSECLRLFNASEFSSLVAGYWNVFEDESVWSVNYLSNNILFSGGYISESPLIQWFISILSESFTPTDRRAFMQFTCGTPCIPYDGIAGLIPNLNINKYIRDSPDSSLPSSQTCNHCVLLPDYSSKEILETKLKYAIYEGCGSFMIV